MAGSYHTRSNSFPNRSNPIVSQFDEQLSRFRSSTSTSSTINSKLSALSGLYDCIDELLQLSSSQKALFNQGHTEEALEGSIKLLDSCNIISDVLAQMKERAQELQSILRRRCSEDEIAMEVAKYLRSRKMAIKIVLKALKDLKKIEMSYAKESNEVINAITMLRDCQMATLNVLESIFFCLAGSKVRNSWDSVVSKLLKSKRVASQQETEFFLVEFEAANACLHPEKVRSGLEKMEISIKNVEDGVEVLFRHLIKTRTTVLNILNC